MGGIREQRERGAPPSSSSLSYGAPQGAEGAECPRTPLPLLSQAPVACRALGRSTRRPQGPRLLQTAPVARPACVPATNFGTPSRVSFVAPWGLHRRSHWRSPHAPPPPILTHPSHASQTRPPRASRAERAQRAQGVLALIGLRGPRGHPGLRGLRGLIERRGFSSEGTGGSEGSQTQDANLAS